MKLDVDYSFYTTKNGAKVVLTPLKDSCLFRIEVWVKCGMGDETEKTYEASHFLEHLVAGFTSKKYPNAITTLSSIGATSNAYTSTYSTVYYIQGAGVDRELITDIMLESVVNFDYDPTIFEQERNAVINELKPTLDKVWYPVNKLVHKLQYTGCPFENYNIQAELESVNNMDHTTLLKYKDRYYVAKNILVTCAGDLGKKPIAFYENVVAPILHKLPKGKHNDWHFNSASPPLIPHKFHFIHNAQATNSSVIVFIFPHPYTTFDIESDVLEILSSILADGLESRLMSILRRQYGYIYGISVSNETDMTGRSIFAIETEIVDPQATPHVVDIIMQELKSICKHGVTEDELTRVKKKIKVKVAATAACTLPSQFTSKYALGAFWRKSPQLYDDELKRAMATSNSDIIECARKVLQFKHVQLVCSGNMSI